MRSVFKGITGILVFSLLSACLAGCQSSDSLQRIEVRHNGALRSIMSGNLEATIALDSLTKKESLFALGAMENLKGEIQIFDSRPSISVVKDGAVMIDTSFSRTGALLVYAEVPEWTKIRIGQIKSIPDLEAEIFELAKEYGIDIDKPFPFQLEGEVDYLQWHIIDWDINDKIHSHEKHKSSGLSGTLKDRSVQILGFYSEDHKGVFTHHTTNIHMHFRTVDGGLAGHLDDLNHSRPITLKLPKK